MRMLRCVGLGFIMVALALVTSSVAGVWPTEWDDQGPTFTDATKYYYPTVVKQGGTYHMWFQRHGGTDDLWYTSSSDGRTGWTAPVQCLLGGAAFTKWQMHPSVMDTGSGFRVYWSGSARGIDVAEADYANPAAWSLVGTDVVTRGGGGQFHYDTASVHTISQWYDGCVYMYDGHYEGYFTSDFGLHYGTSPDGLTNWMAVNTVPNTTPPPDDTTGPPVFQKGVAGEWDSQTIGKPTVLRLADDEYYMWYGGGKSGDPVSYAAGVGFAFSTDGIHWTRDVDNPVLHVTDAGQTYRTRRTYTPCVLIDGSEALMYFSAQYRSGSDFDSIGLATTPFGLATLPPIADPNGPYRILAGEGVTLDGSGSSDPDGGSIVNYLWSVGALSYDAEASAISSLTWPELGSALGITGNGVYTVRLTVTDDEGETAWAETALTVVPEPATLGLLGCAGVSLVVRRRRRTRRP